MTHDPFYKQPQEILPIEMDFTYYCNSTETVSTISATITNDLGIDVSTSMVESAVVADNIAVVDVQGGTDGKRYKLTFRATTDEGHLYEEDVYFDVTEE